MTKLQFRNREKGCHTAAYGSGARRGRPLKACLLENSVSHTTLAKIAKAPFEVII